MVQGHFSGIRKTDLRSDRAWSDKKASYPIFVTVHAGDEMTVALGNKEQTGGGVKVRRE